jgi:hypothetical protein
VDCLAARQLYLKGCAEGDGGDSVEGKCESERGQGIANEDNRQTIDHYITYSHHLRQAATQLLQRREHDPPIPYYIWPPRRTDFRSMDGQFLE